jgi:hypothetical protein
MSRCGPRTAPCERTQASRPTRPALPRHRAPFARADRAAARSLTRDRPGIPLRPGRLQGAASQGALSKPVRALQRADQRRRPGAPEDALPPMCGPRSCEVGQAPHRSRDARMAPTPRPTRHHDRPQPSIRPQASTVRRRRPTRPAGRRMGGRALAGRERRSIPLRHGAARQRCRATENPSELSLGALGHESLASVQLAWQVLAEKRGQPSTPGRSTAKQPIVALAAAVGDPLPPSGKLT